MPSHSLLDLQRVDKLKNSPDPKYGAGMSIAARERLIVALDVPPYEPDPDRLIETADAVRFVIELDEVVSFFKIGWPLYMAADKGHEALINEFLSRGKKVFLDLKFGDIAETVRRLVLVAVKDKVDFITVNTSIEAIQAAVKAREDSALKTHAKSRLKVLTVTLLTSQDREDLLRAGNQMSVEDYVLSKAQQAKDEGHADGVVASGREAAAIRKRLGKDFLIVTPGIRPAGEAHHDHKRATTPAAAIRAGADYLVVGRPITQAQNPREAALRILEEMQKAFDSPQR